MARFFYRLEDNLAGPHKKFGKELLASVTAPALGHPGCRRGTVGEIWFKGGWRPAGTTGTSGAVSHQAALLRHKKSGTKVAIAVLTNETPGESGRLRDDRGDRPQAAQPAAALAPGLCAQPRDLVAELLELLLQLEHDLDPGEVEAHLLVICWIRRSRSTSSCE